VAGVDCVCSSVDTDAHILYVAVHDVLTELPIFSKKYGICVGIVIKATILNVRRVNKSDLSIVRGFATKLTPIRLSLLSFHIYIRVV